MLVFLQLIFLALTLYIAYNNKKLTLITTVLNREGYMNASQIISDDMTLEEKLTAIDKALAAAQAQAQQSAADAGSMYVPLDPAELTMCEGCQ